MAWSCLLIYDESFPNKRDIILTLSGWVVNIDKVCDRGGVGV